jgi:hypothetical protein
MKMASVVGVLLDEDMRLEGRQEYFVRGRVIGRHKMREAVFLPIPPSY